MKDQTASKNALIVAGIAIVILVAIIIYEVFRTKPVSEEMEVNMVKDPNSGLKNMINDLYDNVTEEDENEIVNETQSEEVQNETVENEGQTEENTSSSNATLSKEEQAIQMAMDQYGPSDEEIYFSVDAVDAEGRYIVSVHELETTFLMTSYVVDLEKQTVTEQ